MTKIVRSGHIYLGLKVYTYLIHPFFKNMETSKSNALLIIKYMLRNSFKTMWPSPTILQSAGT